MRIILPDQLDSNEKIFDGFGDEVSTIEITDEEWDKIFSGFICEVYCFSCNSSATIHKARDNFAQYLRELLELKK